MPICLLILNLKAITLNEFTRQFHLTHSTLGTKELLKNNIITSSKSTHLIYFMKVEKDSFYDVDLTFPIDAKSAETQVKNLQPFLEMIYGDSPSPYPGVISNTVKCPQKFKPKLKQIFFQKTKINIYQAAAGDRFQYGVCDEKQFIYNVCSLNYFVEKSNTLHRIKFFNSKSNANCHLGIEKYLSGLL